MDVNEIIESYRQADENGRFILFLQYRDLREEFKEIDSEPAGVELPARSEERALRRLSLEEARM